MSARSRREWLRAFALSLASLPAASCRRALREDGRVVVDLWFSYGGTNREVLLGMEAVIETIRALLFVAPSPSPLPPGEENSAPTDSRSCATTQRSAEEPLEG